MNQRDRVLAMLTSADEVCGSTFYEAYIARFGAVVHRLRRDGYVISKRPCDIEQHHHGSTQWLYSLNGLPGAEPIQLQLGRRTSEGSEGRQTYVR